MVVIHPPKKWGLALFMLAMVLLASCTAQQQHVEQPVQRLPTIADNEEFQIRPVNRKHFAKAFWPTLVPSPYQEPVGTIVIDTRNYQLYLIEANNMARRYGVGVGGTGQAWSGTAEVGRMAKWPAWHPTDDMHAQTPNLPRRIEPGLHNPLGARAIYLYQNGKDTLYRIHGTTEPWTIGTSASSGCIRMINEDAIDLYSRVQVGAKVIVY